MYLKQFKKHFFLALSDHYPETEIQSFFSLLTEFQLKLNRAQVILQPTYEIKKNDLLFLQGCLADLKKHVPIQYILGKTEFYGLDFNVNKHVLIPRPETAELVDWIVKESLKKRNLKILDIGTGSGCIAISLARSLPDSEVYAMDISPESLKVAQKNAMLNNARIHFIEADILALNELPFSFDIIVSNPPYVRDSEKEKIQKNVLENEPHLALFVQDENPFVFYHKISELSKEWLAKNGTLYLEINQYLGTKTVQILKRKGFRHIELRKDLFKNDRMIKARIKE